MMQNSGIVRGLYEAFARGDVPSVMAGLDPTLVWNEAEGNPYADKNPYLGPNAVLEGLFMRLAAEWDDFAATPEAILDAAGDVVLVMGRYRGRFRATGLSQDAQFAHIWWLKGGKIVRFQQYTDTAQAVRVTGYTG
jgi:ketosteroid isomerase-like protein